MRRHAVAAVVAVALTACSAAGGSASAPVGTAPAPAEPGDVVGAPVPWEAEGAPEGSVVVDYLTVGPDNRTSPARMVLFQPADGSRPGKPLAVWAHPTSGVASYCAPSSSAEADLPPWLDTLLAEGWTVAAPDYFGYRDGGHAYMVSAAEGRSVLDAARAAFAVTKSGRVVVYGFSQGGHAALSAGWEHAQGYAPDVPLAAVAAAAPVIDLAAWVDQLSGNGWQSLLVGMIAHGQHRWHPQAPSAAEALGDTDAAALALSCSGTVFDDWGAVTSRVTVNLGDGWPERAAASSPPPDAVKVPVLVSAGADDVLVDPGPSAAWAERRCAAGLPTAVRIWPDTGHDVVTSGGEPSGWMRDWVVARLSGETVAGCDTGG